MHGMVVASLMYSVESVVESIVSGFESHFGPKRTMTDEYTEDEMTIYFLMDLIWQTVILS